MEVEKENQNLKRNCIGLFSTKNELNDNKIIS